VFKVTPVYGIQDHRGQDALNCPHTDEKTIESALLG